MLLLAQPASSQEILDEVRHRIAKATTITVTVTKLVAEFPHPVRTKWWFRKGGYYRSESQNGTLIASPAKCWSYRPTGKTYMEFAGAETDWSLMRATGLGGIADSAVMPPIGGPKVVTWRGRRALSIQVDGTKTMTKETKLYYFFDPKTHDPIGISANLGSVTQVTEFTDLKVNPKIDNSLFRFVPPKWWKRVKGD